LVNGQSPLHHLGVIKVEGDDAAKFLHGQLTQDFALLGTDGARLAALCSPKGRMLASFIGFKCADSSILLICSRDLLLQTMKRLSMFVLRAKVKLSDATDQFALWGLSGDAAAAVLPGSAKPWTKVEKEGINLVQLFTGLGLQRVLYVAAAGAVPAYSTLPPAIWDWLEVQSGVANVGADATDKYVPQMLNYESIGGVNFKKGCYPGQEVVARSQFRGTLKRRAFLIHSDTPLDIGAEIYANASETESVATVVQAADSPTGGYDAIACGNLGPTHYPLLCLGSHDGPKLVLLPLPYPLLEDI
jgi:folate-binding protein YgfZ